MEIEIDSSIDVLNDLPDHSAKLKKIIQTAKTVMSSFNKNKQIDNVPVTYQILCKCLELTALLSISRNDKDSKLKNYYLLKYVKTPAIGRKLYQDHCTLLHKPYDKIKDYLWKSIDALEKFENKLNESI